MLNFEVLNDELVTVEGSARIVSSDGSGTLEITLPVDGSEGNFCNINLDMFSVVISTKHVDKY